MEQRNRLSPQTRLVSDVFQLRIAQNKLRVTGLQRCRIIQECRDISQKEVPALELLVDHITSHATFELSNRQLPYRHAAHVIDEGTILAWVAL